MLEESQKITIRSEAPILHDISLRLKHRSLHFVIVDPYFHKSVDDELASLQPLLQSLTSSSVKTLTLETDDSKTVFECDSTLSDCLRNYLYAQIKV